MKVILKEDIESLGKTGDLIKVADGYARNYLIPKGLAVEATGKNVRMLENERQVVSKQAEKERKRAGTLVQKFAAVTCTIPRRLGAQDKMFGSVTAKDVEKCLREMGIEVDRKSIVMEEPLRTLGEFPAKVRLYAGLSAEFKINIVEEKG